MLKPAPHGIRSPSCAVDARHVPPARRGSGMDGICQGRMVVSDAGRVGRRGCGRGRGCGRVRWTGRGSCFRLVSRRDVKGCGVKMCEMDIRYFMVSGRSGKREAVPPGRRPAGCGAIHPFRCACVLPAGPLLQWMLLPEIRRYLSTRQTQVRRCWGSWVLQSMILTGDTLE